MKRLIFAAALLISGCDNGPQPEAITSTVGTDSGRFSVTQVSKFRDSDAYNSTRKIFLIKDRQTGAEYVGVSGVGISEVGQHTQSNGKTQVTYRDER